MDIKFTVTWQEKERERVEKQMFGDFKSALWGFDAMIEAGMVNIRLTETKTTVTKFTLKTYKI